MPTEQYGQSQILERRFTRQEILDIVKENILLRMGTAYDFDYKNPIIIDCGNEVIFRFGQQCITREPNLKKTTLYPLDKGKTDVNKT